MKYNKYTIEAATEYEDEIAALLYERDITSIEIEDDEVFADEFTGEIYPELQPDVKGEKGARISFYTEEPLSKELFSGIEKEISDFNAVLSEETVDDNDWKDKWKEYFHAFTIDGIHIRPTWEETGDEDADIEIVIDPGMSFGTGAHESTQLILRQMREYLKKGNRVCDVGCGSGILSIAASKLGAGSISGTDIDPDCIASAGENLAANNADIGGGKFLCGDIGSDEELIKSLGEEGFDLVFANILADIIISMADKLYRLTKPGGVLITSGIIDFKLDEVIDALEKSGFLIEKTTDLGEWRSVTAKRP
ncbi:MAG: 50S ribosomal protein L11 methyltransferase [Lachnospiraceae bacterium]|nr:50S ribosomal protein L11 methyltransferase [Lachnospiraceae bacterium]